MIDAHVAVDVQKPHECAARVDTQLSELGAEAFGPTVGRESRELAADRLDLGRAVEPEDAAQHLGVVFLERFGTLDAPQRHQEQGEERCAQAVEGRTDVAVELVRALKQTAGHEHGDRHEHAGAGHGVGGAEQGARVVQIPAGREQPVQGAVHGIDVQAHGEGGGFVAVRSVRRFLGLAARRRG